MQQTQHIAQHTMSWAQLVHDHAHESFPPLHRYWQLLAAMYPITHHTIACTLQDIPVPFEPPGAPNPLLLLLLLLRLLLLLLLLLLLYMLFAAAVDAEMVGLIREPENAYDGNAIRVENIAAEKVGHLNRQLAAQVGGWDSCKHNN